MSSEIDQTAAAMAALLREAGLAGPAGALDALISDPDKIDKANPGVVTSDDIYILTALLASIKLWPLTRVGQSRLRMLERRLAGLCDNAAADNRRETPAGKQEARTRMPNEAQQTYVDAFLDPQLQFDRFRTLLEQFFSDRSINATAEKAVAAAVTGAPAPVLSNRSKRREELERWFAARGRASAKMRELAATETRC